MVLIRRAILCAALATAPACKHSLFDSTIGDDDDDVFDAAGNPDAPVIDALLIDAPPGPDAPIFDADPTDAGIPDAAGPPVCPAVCIADLVENFDGTNDGTNGVWRYLGDQRNQTWSAMSSGTWNGLNGFVGGGSAPQPAIIDCRNYPSDVNCSAVDDRILLVPGQGTAGHHDPATEVSITDDQQYRISGVYTSNSVGSVIHELRIYRNNLYDMLSRTVFDADGAQRSFDTTAEMVDGDRLLMALYPQGSATGTPIGFEQFVSRNTGQFPGRCGVTVRFESISGADIAEDCGLITYKGREWDDASSSYVDLNPVPTATGPIGMGTAVRLAEGQYVLPSGGPVNYTGSFTVQLWVRIELFNFTNMFIYTDWSSASDGGIEMDIDSSGVFQTYVLYPVGQSTGLSFNWPTDNAWHFVRVVRNASANTYRVCLDGQLRGSVPLAGGLDVTSDTPPFLGRNVTYNPPYFQGEIDDVRTFTRALPCQ